MKEFLTRYIFLIASLCISAAVLFQTSQAVQTAEDQKRSLQKDIQAEQQAIDLLNAEWSKLNDPQRLEKLMSALDNNAPSEHSIIFVDPANIEAPQTSDIHSISYDYGGHNE